ncbi:MAG: helix-turn-helix domain-containing protein [Prevotella sp.]|nr:helix-turn-helix domain-containing protein [Prevotella sp.]
MASLNDIDTVFTSNDEPVLTAMQNLKKSSARLSAFMANYRPLLDGERYLTDKEVAQILKVTRRTLLEYRANRVFPFIALGGKILYPESGLHDVLEAHYKKPLT